MISRLAAALIASALVTGCETFTPGGRTVKACRENLISNLNDRESYREDSKPKEIQAEPGQPKVWGWYFNAKNAMGGYGEGKELLCYQEDSGQIIQEIFGSDDPEARRDFLALTSPKIQDEIAKEEAEAERKKAEAKAEKEAEAARAAAEAEAARRIYQRNYRELTAFCRAKSKPSRSTGQYGFLEDFNLSAYSIRNKDDINYSLKYYT